MTESHEAFCFESELRRESMLAWWRGFSTGLAAAFGICVLIGMFLP